jgi:hypothetical protein
LKVHLEPASAAQLIGLDGISVQFCFVSEHAHASIDGPGISAADAALKMHEHVLAASGVFLAIKLRRPS